jgi:hypothetical protein
MRSLALVAAALVLFGSSSAFAQARSPRNAPAMRMTSPAMTTLTTMPVAIPTVGTALGAIQPMAGTPATISGSTVGTVTACATTGVAAVPSSLFNASFADPITGALPPQPLPGATVPPAYSFGTSIMTGACNPTASATATIDALGASVAVTIPGLATTTALTYSDATVPATGMEVGVGGMSPEIVVPSPAVASASPCVGNATVPLTVITDPIALATTSSTAAAMMPSSSAVATTSSSALSLFGC